MLFITIACFKLHMSADDFCRTQYYFLLRTETAFLFLFPPVSVTLCCVASSLLSSLSSYIHFVPPDKEMRFVAQSNYLQHPDSCGFLISMLVLGGEEKLIPMG